MKKYYLYNVTFILFSSLALSGCHTNSRDQVLLTTKSQVELRSFQARAFDTSDKAATLRTIISTLQDLGFVIYKADAMLWSVSATKFGKSAEHEQAYQLKMTVSVRERRKGRLIVRANAQFNLLAVEDPTPYQQFFSALSKALFLAANKVD